MTWTEQNVNNQTKCGIAKYTLKTPSLDNIEEAYDYPHLQHDIKTLYAINGKYSLVISYFFVSFWFLCWFFMDCTDYHVVGCGDRTVSMWDHRNGNLLIDIEIELPTIGRNIACYTVGGEEDVSIFYGNGFFFNISGIFC